MIIIDNNSKDNTKEVVKEYQKKWLKQLPVKYYIQGQNYTEYSQTKTIKEVNYPLISLLQEIIKNHEEKLT